MQTVIGILFGVFQAAYLYEGYLLLVDDCSQLLAVSLQRLLTGLDLSRQERFIAHYSFLRNDLLCSAVVQDLASVGLLRSFSNLYRKRKTFAVEFNRAALDSAPRMPLPEAAGFVLDCAVYFREAIFATRTGAYRALFNTNEDGFQWRDVDRSHDGPVYMLDARYGAVTLACGDDGAMGQIVWRLRNDANGRDPRGWDTQPLLAGNVTRTAWWSQDILAFDAEMNVGCIHNRFTKEKVGEREILRADRLGESGLGWLNPSGLMRKHSLAPTAGFASQHRIYLSDPQRGTAVLRQPGSGVSLGEWRHLVEEPQLVSRKYCYDGQYMPGVGMMADTDDGTLLVAEGKRPLMMSDGGNVCVKVFGKSKYYKRLICNVKNDRVELVAVWPTVAALGKQSTWR